MLVALRCSPLYVARSGHVSVLNARVFVSGMAVRRTCSVVPSLGRQLNLVLMLLTAVVRRVLFVTAAVIRRFRRITAVVIFVFGAPVSAAY